MLTKKDKKKFLDNVRGLDYFQLTNLMGGSSGTGMIEDIQNDTELMEEVVKKVNKKLE